MPLVLGSCFFAKFSTVQLKIYVFRPIQKKLCLPYEVVSVARIQKHKKVLESLIFVGKRGRSRKKISETLSTPVKGPN